MLISRFNNSASSVQPSSGYAIRLSDEEWSVHEADIRRLHSQKATRIEILDNLATSGFTPSPSQLTRQLKKWGLAVYKTHQKQEVISRLECHTSDLPDYFSKWARSQTSLTSALGFLEAAAASASCQRRFNLAFEIYELLFIAAKDWKNRTGDIDATPFMAVSAINCVRNATSNQQQTRLLRNILHFFDCLDTGSSHYVSRKMATEYHLPPVYGVNDLDAYQHSISRSHTTSFFIFDGSSIAAEFQLDDHSLKAVYQQHAGRCSKSHIEHMQLNKVCTMDLRMIKNILEIYISLLGHQTTPQLPDEKSAWPCHNEESKSQKDCGCFSNLMRFGPSLRDTAKYVRQCFWISFDGCYEALPFLLTWAILSDILVQFESKAFDYLENRGKHVGISCREYLFNDKTILVEATKQAFTNILDHNLTFRTSHTIDDINLRDWLEDQSSTAVTAVWESLMSPQTLKSSEMKEDPSSITDQQPEHCLPRLEIDPAASRMRTPFNPKTMMLETTEKPTYNQETFPEEMLSQQKLATIQETVTSGFANSLLPPRAPPKDKSKFLGNEDVEAHRPKLWHEPLIPEEHTRASDTMTQDQRPHPIHTIQQSPDTLKPDVFRDHQLKVFQLLMATSESKSSNNDVSPMPSMSHPSSNEISTRYATDPMLAPEQRWSASSSLKAFLGVARRNQLGTRKSVKSDVSMSDARSIISRMSSNSSWSFAPFINRRSRAESSPMS